jgi:hypothetical protein
MTKRGVLAEMGRYRAGRNRALDLHLAGMRPPSLAARTDILDEFLTMENVASPPL